MQMFELSAIAALIAFAAFVILYAARGGVWVAPGPWIFPAALSAAFAVFSVHTLVTEGFGPLWANHTSNFWGNQVWFDLLIGFAISWVFLVTEGRRLGMSPWLWLIGLFATGNIALLAMLARLLYLRQRGAVAA